MRSSLIKSRSSPVWIGFVFRLGTPMGAFLVAQTVKNLPAMQEARVQSLGQEDPLEKGMVWGFPCSLVVKESACNAEDLRLDLWVGKIPWRRKWQPTPLLVPREGPLMKHYQG